MTDELDAELERLRKDVRKDLDAQRELEQKIDAFDRLPDPAAPVVRVPEPAQQDEDVEEDDDDEAETEEPSAAKSPDLLLGAAKLALEAREKKTWKKLTAGKVVVFLLAALVLLVLVEKVIKPLVFIALVVALIAWVVKTAIGGKESDADAPDEN